MSGNEARRPELTIKEAAEACDVSDKTIRRNLERFPNARRLDAPSGPEAGPWVIPIDDLLGAGYSVNAPSPPDNEPKPEPLSTEAPDAAELRQRIETLETQAANHERREIELRHRAELAEAIAEERSQALDDARLALRMLEAGSAPDTPDERPGTDADSPQRPPTARVRLGRWLSR